MAIKEQLLQEIEETPEPLLEEVLNFLRTVKQQNAIQPSQHSKQETVGQQILRFAAEARASTPPEEAEKATVGQWLVGLAKKIESEIPPEELDKSRSDGAEQHDHFYGTPKRLMT